MSEMLNYPSYGKMCSIELYNLITYVMKQIFILQCFFLTKRKTHANQKNVRVPITRYRKMNYNHIERFA